MNNNTVQNKIEEMMKLYFSKRNKRPTKRQLRLAARLINVMCSED